MREIVLSIIIETEILDKKEQIGISINIIQELHEDGITIDEFIITYMEEYMQDNYCSCSFNESQNYCDCGCGEWGYDYNIISIESEKGGEL